MNSVIVTVHNKSWLIGAVVDKLIKHTAEPFELVVVYDGCTDDSRARVEQVIAGMNGRAGFNALARYIPVVTPDVFEVRANNAGIRAASGEFLLLLQDDMIVDEDGWDAKLLAPIRKWPDVFISSASQACNLHAGDGADIRESVGIIDDGSARRAYARVNPGEFIIRDFVNRGPIAMSRARMLEMECFDESFYPQMWDDTDICYRAYREHGWVSGVSRIEVMSDVWWGASRIKKGQGTLGTTNQADAKTATVIYDKTWSENLTKVLDRHGDLIRAAKHDETRLM